MESVQKNIFGMAMESCSCNPMTGFYRDGFCHTGEQDQGKHLVCAVMTDEFLSFSKSKGNDLSTPRTEWGFPGLKAGDHWCLCVLRWVEAFNEDQDIAPKLVLSACHESTLEYVPLEVLKQFGWSH